MLKWRLVIRIESLSVWAHTHVCQSYYKAKTTCSEKAVKASMKTKWHGITLTQPKHTKVTNGFACWFYFTASSLSSRISHIGSSILNEALSEQKNANTVHIICRVFLICIAPKRHTCHKPALLLLERSYHTDNYSRKNMSFLVSCSSV